MAKTNKNIIFRLPSTKNTHPDLSSKDKIALTRKANELFNEGQIEAAGRIYLSVGYSAGLAKLGAYYKSKGELIKALEYFNRAGIVSEVESISARFAGLIRKWLKESL